MNSTPMQRILERLDNVKQHGDYYTARCPAHDDHNNSLSVREGDDGRVLAKCHAGCEFADIAAALGLKERDFYPNHDPVRVKRTDTTARGGGVLTPQTTLQPCNANGNASSEGNANNLGCTLADYAALKSLPMDFLRSIGLSDMKYLGTPAVRIPYMDRGGANTATRFRIALTKTENADDRFRWNKGAKVSLYGLWRVGTPEAVVLNEGESDVHTSWYHGIPALGVPGANNWNEARDAPHLDGIATIYVVIEPDAGGDAVKKWLASSRIRDRVRLVSLGEYKDVSALHIADPEQFAARWQAALEAAVPFSDEMQADADAERAAAWEQCRALAEAANILALVTATVRRAGLVGEERVVKLLYLVLITRFLPRPASVVIKGPSSGGKSYTVERALAFFPDATYYALSAMSERALAYSEEPLTHRFLVIYEAAGMTGEFASYLMRSLLSEGRVRYETVEKTKDGLRARLIEREGPTGLIVTTTAVHLHAENETRLLSLTVTDTREQTAAVLTALAENRAPVNEGAVPTPIDYAPWHALQVWLTGAEHHVVIPFALTLAALIPPIAVRLRRDFGALLTLIQGHAILHQCRRERDEHGSIVATLDDYAAVRELIADLVSEGVEATVPESVRDTVRAVRRVLGTSASDDVTASVTQVARELKLDKGAASRRVRVAIDRGFLKNLEDKRGQPARLRLGEGLPEDMEVLPTADSLRDALRCSVAVLSKGVDTPSPTAMVTESTDAGTDDVQAEWDEWEGAFDAEAHDAPPPDALTIARQLLWDHPHTPGPLLVARLKEHGITHDTAVRAVDALIEAGDAA